MSVDQDPQDEPAALPEPPTDGRLTQVRERLGAVAGTVGRQAVAAVTTLGGRVGQHLVDTLTGTDTSITYNGHHVTIDGDEDGIVHADALFAGAVEGHDLVLEYDRTHGLTVELLLESEQQDEPA